jgi:hypothetical protein
VRSSGSDASDDVCPAGSQKNAPCGDILASTTDFAVSCPSLVGTHVDPGARAARAARGSQPEDPPEHPGEPSVGPTRATATTSALGESVRKRRPGSQLDVPAVRSPLRAPHPHLRPAPEFLRLRQPILLLRRGKDPPLPALLDRVPHETTLPRSRQPDDSLLPRRLIRLDPRSVNQLKVEGLRWRDQFSNAFRPGIRAEPRA